MDNSFIKEDSLIVWSAPKYKGISLWIQESIDWTAETRLLRSAEDLNISTTISIHDNDFPRRLATSHDVWTHLILNQKFSGIDDSRCLSRTIKVANGWWFKEAYEQDGDLKFESCGWDFYKNGMPLITSEF